MIYSSPVEMKFLKSIKKIRDARLMRAEREAAKAAKALLAGEEKVVAQQQELGETEVAVAQKLQDLRAEFVLRSVTTQEFGSFLQRRDRAKTEVHDAKMALQQAEEKRDEAKEEKKQADQRKQQVAKQCEKVAWVIDTRPVREES